MEEQTAEKSFLRIITKKIVIPTFAFGSAFILIWVWPPILLVYLGAFIVLVIIASVGFWKGEY